MVLVLGLLIVCVLAVGVVVDASAVFLKRREVQAVADAAALAGAQAIDLDAYYASGAEERIRLDPRAIEGAVRRQVGRSGMHVDLESVSLQGDVVVVRVSDWVRPPFSGWLTPGGRRTIDVEAGATLTYRP